MNIGNVNIRKLECLIANIIFKRNDSQNVCSRAELFLIWYAITRTHVNTGALISCHLVDVAKITHESVIGVGGTITVIAQALGHEGKFGSLEPHFVGGGLDIATLAHITIIDTKAGINKYPYHIQLLFTLPEVTRTTISNKRNWNYDHMIVREVAMPRKGDEAGEEGEEGTEDDDYEECKDVGQEAQPYGGPQGE